MTLEERAVEALLRETLAQRAGEVSFEATQWAATLSGLEGESAAGAPAAAASAGTGVSTTAMVTTGLGLVGLAAAAVVTFSLASGGDDVGARPSTSPSEPGQPPLPESSTVTESSSTTRSSTSSTGTPSTSPGPTGLPVLPPVPAPVIPPEVPEPRPTSTSVPPATTTGRSATPTRPSPTVSTSSGTPTRTPTSPASTSPRPTPSVTSPTVRLERGEAGRAGSLCTGPGECREILVTTTALLDGQYSLRCIAWPDRAEARSTVTTARLGPARTTTRTGCYASTSIGAVEVEVHDASGERVATSGRVPW